MREIKLNKGMVAMVDDSDFDWLNQWNWQAYKRKHTFYAERHGPAHKMIKMHRLILGFPDKIVDHADMNGLNNQRNNLRLASTQQSASNRHGNINSTSKYKGVSLDRTKNLWHAQIMTNKINKHIGFFKNEVDAAVAYNEVAIKSHGEFAHLNKL